MKPSKYTSLYEDFAHAVNRFDEILAIEKNDVVRDSAIKRFELVFDLGWKTVKAYLEEQHNAVCISPRQCFREAFRTGLIDHDSFWIEITDTRNYTVHTYNEALAEKIYAALPKALEHYKSLRSALEQADKE